MNPHDLYLMHHGVKGMHWGVRRYQNSDGTLTNAGKAHAKIKRKKKLSNSDKEKLRTLGLAATAGIGGAVAMYGAKKMIGDYKKGIKEDKEWAEFMNAQRKADEYWDEIGKKAKEDAQRAYEKTNEAFKNAYKNTYGDDWEKYWNAANGNHDQFWKDRAKNASSGGNGNSSSSSSETKTPNVKKNTAENKSNDRAKKYDGVTLDPVKTQARVKELRDKVIKAQQDGTVTAEMVDELQEAMAQNKAAKAQMMHSLGFICFINRDSNYLMHYGLKGMKWGVRRFEDSSGHLTPAGKRRYGIQDARKYYKINRLERKREKTRDLDKQAALDARIRRVQTRSDRKHADLTQNDINIGREIVAKNRKNMHIAATAAAGASTAAATAILYANPNTRWAAPLVAAGGAAATAKAAGKIPYYKMEDRRYKQVNQPGSTKQGTTKTQRALKKAAKIAGTAALIGGGVALAGYTAKKVGEHRDYNRAYKNADAETRAAMDAERHYNQGVAIRNAAKSGYNAASAGAKKAYDFATDPNTHAAIKRGAAKVKRVATSDEAKSIARKTKNAAARTGRGIADIARGVTGVGGRSSSTSSSASSSASSSTSSSTTREASEATRQIIQATKQLHRQRQREERRAARNAQARQAIYDAKDQVGKAIKNRARDATLGKDFDPDEPSTWGKAGMRVVNTARRGRAAVKAVKSMRG